MDNQQKIQFYKDTETASEKLLHYLEEHCTMKANIASRDTSKVEINRKIKKIPYAFTGRDTVFSAGCYPKDSLSYVLPIISDFIDLGYIFRIGSLEENIEKKDVSYLQIVLLKVKDRYCSVNTLLAKRSLSGIMPGYLAKSFSMQTTVKLHTELVDNNFNSEKHEAMIYQNYKPYINNENITIITGYDCDEHISELKKIINPVENNIQQIKKSIIDKNYEECQSGLNCNTCEESVICDNIRDFMKNKGRK